MGELLAYQYTCLKFYNLSDYQAYTFRQVPLYHYLDTYSDSKN